MAKINLFRKVVSFHASNKTTWQSFRWGKLLPFLIRLNVWIPVPVSWVYHSRQKQEKISEYSGYPVCLPCSEETQQKTLPIYCGIGVGVYQGHHVILRQLEASLFSQNWVVERLRSYNLYQITKQQAFQLYQLAILILLLQQSDRSENDLRILDEIELEIDCPHSKELDNLESLPQVVCGSEKCPLQKLLLKLPKLEWKSQYLLCPFSPLIRK